MRVYHGKKEDRQRNLMKVLAMSGVMISTYGTLTSSFNSISEAMANNGREWVRPEMFQRTSAVNNAIVGFHHDVFLGVF